MTVVPSAVSPSFLHLQCSSCGRRERFEIREGTIDDAMVLADRLGWQPAELCTEGVAGAWRCPDHPWDEDGR